MPLDNDTLLARFATEHYERHSISQQRRQQNTAVLRVLAEQLGDRTLIELTPSDIMEFQGSELKRGIAPNTVRKKQNMIRAFVGWAYGVQLIDFERTMRLKSVNGVRGAVAHLKPKPYKRTEIQTFREALAEKYPLLPTTGKGTFALRQFLRGGGQFNAHMKRHARRLLFEAKVSLALEEGLRCVEIFNLSIADMHPENECVVVRTAKAKPGQRPTREVPFTPHSRLCVEDWLDFRELLVPGHDFPWLSLHTREVPRREIFTQHLQALDVIEGHWNWHRFRHTFATERLRAGMPLEQLQVMLGHARLEQTLAYAEIVSADVRIEAARTDAKFAQNIGLMT